MDVCLARREWPFEPSNLSLLQPTDRSPRFIQTHPTLRRDVRHPNQAAYNTNPKRMDKSLLVRDLAEFGCKAVTFFVTSTPGGQEAAQIRAAMDATSDHERLGLVNALGVMMCIKRQ